MSEEQEKKEGKKGSGLREKVSWGVKTTRPAKIPIPNRKGEIYEEVSEMVNPALMAPPLNQPTPAVRDVNFTIKIPEPVKMKSAVLIELDEVKRLHQRQNQTRQVQTGDGSGNPRQGDQNAGVGNLRRKRSTQVDDGSETSPKRTKRM